VREPNIHQAGVRAFLLTSPLGVYWLLNGYFVSKLNPLVLLLVDFVFVVLGTLASLFLLRPVLGDVLRELGLVTSPRAGARKILEDSVVCTLVLLFAGWFVSTLAWAYLWRVDWVRTSELAFSWNKVSASLGARVPIAFYLAVSAAFAEEIYFRGVLRIVVSSMFAPRIASNTYCFVSAAYFSAIHWEGGLTLMITMFVWGFIAARLFIWTKDLRPLIVAHFCAAMVQLV